MIKKAEGGYKVLSEKGKKISAAPTKQKRKPRKDCSRWNTSSTKKANAFDVVPFPGTAIAAVTLAPIDA